MDNRLMHQISSDETSRDPAILSCGLPLLRNDSEQESEEDVFEDSRSHYSSISSVKSSASIDDDGDKSTLTASTKSVASTSTIKSNAGLNSDHVESVNSNGYPHRTIGSGDMSHGTSHDAGEDDDEESHHTENEDNKTLFKRNGKSSSNKSKILPRKYMNTSYPYIKPAYQEKRHRQPCSITCCHRSCQWPKLLTWSRCCEQNNPEDDEEDFEDEPLRKRFCRAFFTLVYISLAAFAVFVTYAMIQDLVISMDNPVTSVHHTKVDEYSAPGIALYAGSAKFLACGHYYNNVVLSKVSLTQLDLTHQTCNFTDLYYTDPHFPDMERHVTIMRGPTSFVKREAIFLHFELEDELRDFFTVSYYVFPDYDDFVKLNISEQQKTIADYHRVKPTFALSAGLRMWIKLIMSELHLMDGTKHTDFKVEYSVVRFHDRREEEERNRHLFFIFFEWKNDVIEQSYLIYTTTPWSIGAGLCGVFLTLHKGYQFSRTSYQRVQKDKAKRSIRKRTFREMREKRKSMVPADVDAV